MVVVIGDIHGMLDPLKNLIQKLEQVYLKLEYNYDMEAYEYVGIDELIFLGDYIDYGPSSKEVIDYITALPYKKTFLAGNHEDLLLQYYHKEIRVYNFSEKNWLSDNEGYKTLCSLCGVSRKMLNLKGDALQFDEKYMNFFEKLQYSYEKVVGGVKYLFTHAYVEEFNKINAEELLQMKKFDEFHNYIKEKDILLYITPVWMRKDCNNNNNRKDIFEKYKDYVVVHGHTPVCAMEYLAEEERAFGIPWIESGQQYEMKQTETAVYIGDLSTFELAISTDEIYGINVDTGVSLGIGISALVIDSLKPNEYNIIQARTDCVNKYEHYIRQYKYILNGP